MHHLAAGACLGALMVSPMIPWVWEYYDSDDDPEELLAATGPCRDNTPRVCRVPGAASIEPSQAVRAPRAFEWHYDGGGAALVSDWKKMSMEQSTGPVQQDL